MGILSNVKKALSRSSNNLAVPPSQQKTQPLRVQEMRPDSEDGRRFFLNQASSRDSANNVILLAAVCEGEIGESNIKQKLKNGQEMQMNPDGSYIIRSEEGVIVRTCDAAKVKREFSRDPETGELTVIRFGLVSKPENASVDEEGTFRWRNNQVDVEERLNGKHIQTNRITGVMIETDTINRVEVVKMDNGEVWRRETTDHKEIFCIWVKGKLSFKGETYFSPERQTIETCNGKQPLAYVSRYEESWNDGRRTREKCCFRNPVNGRKHVEVSVTLSTGALTLKNVVSVVTSFADGQPTETLYQLAEPIDMKVDIPGKKTSLPKITQVRNFQAGSNLGLVFRSSTGDEYVIFTGEKGCLENRARAAAAAKRIDDAYSIGEQPADLVIR